MNIYLQSLMTVCLSNKYTKWYCDIIGHAIIRQDLEGYFERHHILPKSFKMGGATDPLNIVKLTAKEHFICHRLLPKMLNHKGLRLKMSSALLYMSYGNGQTPKHIPPASTIESIKKEYGALKKGTKGKKWTPEQRKKLEKRIPHNKGVPMSEEAKDHLRVKRAEQVMGPVKDTTKEKIAQTLTGKTKGCVWWTNGIVTKRQKECPGPDFVRGSLQDRGIGKKWWTNDVEENKCYESPGEGWRLGRKKRQIK